MEECSIAGAAGPWRIILLCTCGWFYEERRRQGTLRSTMRVKAQWNAHMQRRR